MVTNEMTRGMTRREVWIVMLALGATRTECEHLAVFFQEWGARAGEVADAMGLPAS